MESIPNLDDLKRRGNERAPMPLPEQVVYATHVMPGVTADGMVALTFVNVQPDGMLVPVQVLIHPTQFAAGIVAHAHEIMTEASQQLTAVAEMVAGAVAQRQGMMNGGVPGAKPSSEQMRDARRKAAGD